MRGNHVQIECIDPDCGGHDGASQREVKCMCAVCGGAEASLPTECPGRRMTPDEDCRVSYGLLDYYDGRWHTFAP